MGIRELLSQFGGEYLSALLMTYRLTFLSFAMALVIGIVITVMRISPIKPLQYFGNFYVQVFRNIPGAALLIMLVYALPYLNVMLSYYTCVLVAVTLIPASFCSEYLMAGINTISPGQFEAARSLGMTFMQMIKNVVIPQALRSTVLQLTNLLVATMLTTALASQVPRPMELTSIVNYVNRYVVGGIAPFIISGFFYCMTAVVIGQIGNRIDRKVRIMR